MSNYILFKTGSLVSFLASWFQNPLALTHTTYIQPELFSCHHYTSAWSGFHTALSKSNLEYHPSAPPSLLNTPPCTYISSVPELLQRALLFQPSVNLLRKGPCIALPLWLIDSFSLVKCYWQNARCIVQLLQSCTKPFDPSHLLTTFTSHSIIHNYGLFAIMVYQQMFFFTNFHLFGMSVVSGAGRVQ